MILKAENIHKAFGKRKVLTGVSVNLEKGKIYGIAGENGSGKSTLLKSLIGYSKIDKGKVKLYGSFGYCPQSPQSSNEKTFHCTYRLRDSWRVPLARNSGLGAALSPSGRGQLWLKSR